MNFEEYRALSALNWSTLRDVHVSPLLCRWRQDNPRPDTSSLSLGRLIHTAILEPERYDEEVLLRPSQWDSWRTKAAREWRAEQEAEGRIIIDDETAELVSLLRSRVIESAGWPLLCDTRREVSIQWTAEVGGSQIPCKGRLDAVTGRRLVDLKTTKDLKWFWKDAAELLYHGGLAWYLDGALAAGEIDPAAVAPYLPGAYGYEEIDDDAGVYIIALETSEPYDAGAWRLPPYVIQAGRRLHRSLLETWSSCREADLWPGREPVVTDLHLPTWAAGMANDEREVIL